MRVARVFPRRTRATPVDADAFVGEPDLLTRDYDQVEISVTFTWDVAEAERLARAWRAHGGKVEIGGPAFGKRWGEFERGRYLKPGYVITSRGCPRRCWFCRVPAVEGMVRTLPIQDGYDVLDDNLLACPRGHVEAVFRMLRQQASRARFSGGLDVRLLADWHIEKFLSFRLKPELFFAFDGADEWEPLVIAATKLREAGYMDGKHLIRAYVLCGYPNDTFPKAESRMGCVKNLGITPMAMCWHSEDGARGPGWAEFQRRWARPAIIWSQKAG